MLSYEGVGDGRLCISGIPTPVHMPWFESQDDTGLGLDGTILHASTGAGCTAEICWEGHQVSEMVELGRIGVGRMISTTGFGGGGSSGTKRFDI